MSSSPLLLVDGLHVEFKTTRGIVNAVQGVSYSVNPGEMTAIVGESGSGKSVSAMAIMGLLPKKVGRTPKGRVMFDGRDLLKQNEATMGSIRGKEIGMIFQEPMTSLNPVLTIGDQITEPLLLHMSMSGAEADTRAKELLQLVGISDAERRLRQYPHEFSGGMRQRVMIAIGLSCNPKLLIADEPTTALDVTIQAQILELMKKLSRELDIAMIIITHNLGIVARYADSVNVMYAAQIVEQADAVALFSTPKHPYTSGLLRAVPRLDRPREVKLATIDGLPPDMIKPPSGCRFKERCPAAKDICAIEPTLDEVSAEHWSRCHRAAEMTDNFRGELYPVHQSIAGATDAANDIHVNGVRAHGDSAEVVLDVQNLTKHFKVRLGKNPFSKKSATVKAVDGLSFTLNAGQTLGLVGESGCGKTTVGRSILRLIDPTSGDVNFHGENIAHSDKKSLDAMRRKMQVIFQDPFASLNPRMTVGQIIAEPLQVYKLVGSKLAARKRVGELLSNVGLVTGTAERYPHQLSGGQRQRVGIARSLAMQPSTIICDEPVSALDVSVQAQIMNLLEELQQEFGLSYVFIAHDLAVVRHISHRVVVMYLGKVMEMADCDVLYSKPLHPYTKALMDAAPIPDASSERLTERLMLEGEIPSPLSPPAGCVFSSRCPLAIEACKKQTPPLKEYSPGHFAACIRIEERH